MMAKLTNPSSFFAGTLTLKPALDDEDKVVHFVDPDFETADTLRLFLLLATKSTVPDDLCYRQLHDLAMFLKKYRCRRPIGVLRSILCCRVDSNNYMNIFAAASYMDRMDLAEFVCGYMLREREKAPSTRTDLYFTALIEWLEENSLTEKTKKRHDSLLQTLRAVLKDKAPLDDPWGVLLKELVSY